MIIAETSSSRCFDRHSTWCFLTSRKIFRASRRYWIISSRDNGSLTAASRLVCLNIFEESGARWFFLLAEKVSISNRLGYELLSLGWATIDT